MTEIIEVSNVEGVVAKIDASYTDVLILTIAGGKPMLKDRLLKLGGQKGIKCYVSERRITSVHPATTIEFTLKPSLDEDEQRKLITCMERKVAETITAVQARGQKSKPNRRETKMTYVNPGVNRRHAATTHP